jgi:hypothetical protein
MERAQLVHWRWGIMAAILGLVTPLKGAEQLGDIVVAPQAMYSGNTFHGYAETRVSLENHSMSRSHNVTLVFPNRTWDSGNRIDHLSRTVTLAPGAHVVVPLLQPPLPANGDSAIRVEVDGHEEGTVRAPNANNHLSRDNRGGPPVVFISRSLDSEAVERVFKANHGGFTPVMATGPPDASGSGGYRPAAWMPDTREYGKTNWLNLDYVPPLAANKISIYWMSPLPPTGEILVTGVSGTNLVRLPMAAGRSVPGAARVTEFSFALTGEPVKTVRLNFEKAPPYNIGIDAVQISGPSGSAWAADAQASSDNSAQASSYGRGAPGDESTEGLRAELPVPAWSENWLAYTPFDAMVLDAADFNSMPSAVLAAIGNYLESGGNVFVFGPGDLPGTWPLSQKKPLDNSLDGFTCHVGLGTCLVSPAKNFSFLDPKTVQLLRNTVNATAHYWQSLPEDSGAANVAFPVVENVKIPVRGIVFVMLAFVTVIGPVNIVLLNRRKRRTWMLWTVPAISLATTLLVFTYSLLREGITPDVRITGLTVLDQAGHHATTVGVAAFYCPLTPSQGLNYDYETEVTPLTHVGYGSGTPREVDWTQTQHLGRGWVVARVPAHFHLRKSESRHERLQIENENGRWQAVNGLGAPIKSLWLADAGGRIYQASNIAAGQKAGMIASSHPPASGQLGADGLFREIGFTAHLDSVHDNPEKYLLPGTYIAELDGNPFIENALGTASQPKRTRISAVVYGILDSPKTR